LRFCETPVIIGRDTKVWSNSNRIGREYRNFRCCRRRNNRSLPPNSFVRGNILPARGIVEGFNKKVKLTVRKGYGYASNKSLQTTMYQVLGKFYK